jgi:hypothetical protein
MPGEVRLRKVLDDEEEGRILKIGIVSLMTAI